MSLDKSQIIPFPLPEHLCLFISERLNTPIETIGDNIQVKALHVSSFRPSGKYILKCLEKANKPKAYSKGITMYISTSKYISTNNKNIVECRDSVIEISPKEISEITEVFEDMFRMCLVSFLDGSFFGSTFKKGKHKYALVEFLKKYNLGGCDKTFEKYKKYYSRVKKQGKILQFS